MRLQFLFKRYRLINVLSIDVVIGAVCSAAFFARLMDVDVSFAAYLALALCVWMIYTVDHIVDAHNSRSKAMPVRYVFHGRYSVNLSGMVVAAALVELILLFFLRARLIIGGVMLFLALILYVYVTRYLPFLKELFISILYTLGVLLPALCTMNEAALVVVPLDVIGCFWLTALINLVLFSWFDFESDLQNGFKSVATILGKESVAAILVTLIVMNLAISALSMRIVPAALLLLMNIILLVVYLKHRLFAQRDFYRLVGDAVFYLPGLVMLFPPDLVRQYH